MAVETVELVEARSGSTPRASPCDPLAAVYKTGPRWTAPRPPVPVSPGSPSLGSPDRVLMGPLADGHGSFFGVPSVPSPHEIEREEDDPHEGARDYPVGRVIDPEGSEGEYDRLAPLALSFVVQVDPDIGSKDDEKRHQRQQRDQRHLHPVRPARSPTIRQSREWTGERPLTCSARLRRARLRPCRPSPKEIMVRAVASVGAMIYRHTADERDRLLAEGTAPWSPRRDWSRARP